MEKVLSAPKMSCGHCKMAVENAVGSVAGVSSVSADPQTKEVAVAFDEDQVSLEEIIKAMAEAGYPAE